MASSRLTSLNENVSTYGDGTRDYTSLGTWEAATDIDLVTATAGERLECYPDAEFDDSILLISATTSAEYFRTITCAPGNEPNGVFSNGVVFRYTGGAGTVFNINENYAALYDLSLSKTGNTTGTMFVVSAGVTSPKIVGVVIDEAVNNGTGGITGIALATNTSGAAIVNCGVFNCESIGIALGATGANNYVFNCTAVGNDKGFAATGGSERSIFINCLADNNTTYDFGTEGAATISPSSDFNASSDATAPGSSSRIDQTFTFLDALNGDYHLDETDEGAKDFGTDLSADASYPFDDDTDGDTRTGDWDIGFDEFVVVSSGGSIITIYRRRRR